MHVKKEPCYSNLPVILGDRAFMQRVILAALFSPKEKKVRSTVLSLSVGGSVFHVQGLIY